MEENLKKMNQGIVVDDGSRRVPILNKDGEEIGVFRFHPTDVGIIKRYNDLAASFDSIVEPLDALNEADMDIDDPKYAQALGAAERKLYAAVDALFASEGASEAFFGQMNPFSPVDGEFYCTRVLSAVGDYISAAFETETAKFSDKAQAYARKATRRGGAKK